MMPRASGAGLVLDLSGITYCDSTGVSVLVHAYRRTEATGTMLALAGAAPEVFRLLSLTGLDRFFRSYDSVDTAITPSPPNAAAWWYWWGRKGGGCVPWPRGLAAAGDAQLAQDVGHVSARRVWAR